MSDSKERKSDRVIALAEKLFAQSAMSVPHGTKEEVAERAGRIADRSLILAEAFWNKATQ